MADKYDRMARQIMKHRPNGILRAEDVAKGIRAAAAEERHACAMIARDEAEKAYRERLDLGASGDRIGRETAGRTIQHAIEDRARGEVGK